MTEGTTSPRVRLRAGPILYAVTLTASHEGVQQLGDLIRLQATEYDLLSNRSSLDMGTALYAWSFATTVVNDALAKLEGAHAAVDALTPDVLRIISDAGRRTDTE